MKRRNILAAGALCLTFALSACGTRSAGTITESELSAAVERAVSEALSESAAETEPAETEPAVTEPAETESTETESTETEPADSEPAAAAPTEAPAEAPVPAEPEVQSVSAPASRTASCMSGQVTVELEDYSQEDSSLTVRITNNSSEDITTFGFPSLIVNGQTTELNPFDNMSVSQVEILAGSYSSITYVVDPSVFENGAVLKGDLWVMNPTVQDRSYQLEINM